MKTAWLLFIYIFCTLPLYAFEEKQILFTSSFPDITSTKKGGFPHLASLLKEKRQKNKDLLFLFGGNSLGPSAMSFMDKGSHIIDILNSLEPDVMSANKREFSFFEDELSLRSYEASFPIVSSNIYDVLEQKNLNGLYDSLLIEKDDIKYGVISVLQKNVLEEYALKRLVIKDIKSSIKKYSEKLKSQGADIIVVMASDKNSFFNEFIEENIVNIVFVKDEYEELLKKEKNTNHKNYIILSNKQSVALVKITKENNKYIYKKELLNLSSYKKDKDILTQINSYKDRLNIYLNERVAFSKSPLNTKRKNVRSEENAFANILTDAIKDYTKADISLLNGGTIRGDKFYKENIFISRKDILTELPYRNRIVLLKIKGKVLLEALENGFSKIENLKGRFPHISGMKVVYNSSKKVGSRVEEVFINKKKLDLLKTYTLSTSDYIAMGGDGYSMFLDSQKIKFKKPKYRLISDIIIDYLLSKRALNAKIENRLVDLSKE